MVKYTDREYCKLSDNLVPFRRPNFKNFFNHGDGEIKIGSLRLIFKPVSRSRSFMNIFKEESSDLPIQS